MPRLSKEEVVTRETRMKEILQTGLSPNKAAKKLEEETGKLMGYYRVLELAAELGLHSGKVKERVNRSEVLDHDSELGLSEAPPPLPKVTVSQLATPAPNVPAASDSPPGTIPAHKAELGKKYVFAHNVRFGGTFVENHKGVCYFDMGKDGSRCGITSSDLIMAAE